MGPYSVASFGCGRVAVADCDGEDLLVHNNRMSDEPSGDSIRKLGKTSGHSFLLAPLQVEHDMPQEGRCFRDAN